jgi:hypothetical protein
VIRKLLHPLFLLPLVLMVGSVALAQTAPTTRPAPAIAIAPAVEEGRKVLHATVTLDGKPLRDVKVQFAVARTFGRLPIGDDTTDDDGVAAVDLPRALPGDERGELNVIATIASPAAYAGTSQAQSVPGGIPIVAPGKPTYPRALWAPHAPLPLLVSVLGAVGAVWFTYAVVVAQILAIRKEGRS